MGHVTHIWVMLHMYGSCRTCEWVTSHTRMSHVIRTKSIMSHMYMSHVAHIKAVSHIRMSHVTCVNKSCRTWNDSSHVQHDSFTRVTWLIRMCDTKMSHFANDMNHVAHENMIRRMCDMSHLHVWHDGNESCRTWEQSCCTYEWVASHIRMHHIAHIYDLLRTYVWVTAQIWMSFVTGGQAEWQRSDFTYKWVMSNTNESCRACEWVVSHVMSHIRKSHVAHMYESRRIYEWVMSHIQTSHVANLVRSCHISCRTYTRWYVTWLISFAWAYIFGHRGALCPWVTTYTWVTSHDIYMSHESRTHLIKVTYVRRKCVEFTCANGNVCDMTHLICMCIQIRSCPISCRTYEWVTLHIRVGHVAHMNSTCHTHFLLPRTLSMLRLCICMSHVTRMNDEWVMRMHYVSGGRAEWRHVAHMNESRCAYGWVTSHIWLRCVTGGRAEWRHVAHMNESRCAYGWVTSHIWKSHVAHTNESRRTYEWVTLRIRMSHVAHMTSLCHRWTSRVTSCRTYEWVTLRIWMSPFANYFDLSLVAEWYHVEHMEESRCAYEWVMSHIWMSHVAHTSESRRAYKWVMLRIRMSRVARMNGSRCAYGWVTSHNWLHCVTGGRAEWQRLDCYDVGCPRWPSWGVWRDSFTCVTWLIHVCDVTHSYVWHDAFMSHDVGCPVVAILRCVTWLIHVCGMTHSCVWHDSFICVTWPIHESWCELPCVDHSEVCGMIYSRVCHDSLTCVTWHVDMWDITCACVLHDSVLCVAWLIHVCDVTHG